MASSPESSPPHRLPAVPLPDSNASWYAHPPPRTQHAVEKWIRADIPADIEAAGQIVQGNRADTRHENTVEHALVILEGIPIETAGMRDNMIDLVVLFIQDHIRKVVILVYDKVKGIAQAAGFGIQHVQLVKSLSGKTEPTMNSSL